MDVVGEVAAAVVVSAVAAVPESGAEAVRGPAEDFPVAGEPARVADLLEVHAPVLAAGRLAVRPPLGPAEPVRGVQRAQPLVRRRAAVPGRVRREALALEGLDRDCSRERAQPLALAEHAPRPCQPRVRVERRESGLAQELEPDPLRAREWPIVPALRRNQPGCRDWGRERSEPREWLARGWEPKGLACRTGWPTGRDRFKTGSRT